MKAKTYLYQAREIEQRIKRRQEELNMMGARTTYISGMDYSKDRVQTSPSGTPWQQRQAEMMADIEREIHNSIDALIAIRHEIIGQIESLDVENHRALLFKRYIEYKSFRIISAEMNYDYNYILTMHGEALRCFEKNVLNIL